MPATTDKGLVFKLHIAPSVVYTLGSAFIEADESLDSGGAQ